MAEPRPVEPRTDIVPFMFPCPNCQCYMFHGVYEQPHGLGFGLMFLPGKLWYTHRAYHVICEKCSYVNAQISKQDVDKLAGRCLPRSLYTAYPAIHQIYQPGFYRANRSLLVGETTNPEDAVLVDEMMAAYRLEI